jgi:hypothetical protein
LELARSTLDSAFAAFTIQSSVILENFGGAGGCCNDFQLITAKKAQQGCRQLAKPSSSHKTPASMAFHQQ